ncbi:hypothetical protein Tco_0071918 [Tanacetum coccineum]
MYLYTNFRSNISQGDCFIPFDIKQSFSRLVNLLEVKQHVSTSVKEINYARLGIVNQAELKLQPRAFFSFVIVNGDAHAVASASTEGPIPPKTAEQKIVRKNELKAKSTLLLAIPDEHLLKFHGIKDAKSL